MWGIGAPEGSPDFPEPQTFGREEYQRTYQDPDDDWGREGGVFRCDDMGKNLELVAVELATSMISGLTADSIGWAPIMTRTMGIA